MGGGGVGDGASIGGPQAGGFACQGKAHCIDGQW
jgi:hypothetical protein